MVLASIYLNCFPGQHPTVVLAELSKGAYGARRDAFQLWFGKKQQCFDTSESLVESSLHAFVLHVLHAADAFHDDVGTDSLSQIYSEILVAYYAYAFLVGIDFPDGFHTFLSAEEGMFVGINAYTDDDAPKQRKDAPDNVVVTSRKGVESAYE